MPVKKITQHMVYSVFFDFNFYKIEKIKRINEWRAKIDQGIATVVWI